MNFLADESCDFAVVRALRNEGYNVIAVAEVTPAADDEDIIGLAYSEAKILLTEDKDFGRLVYAHAHPSGWRNLNPFPFKYPPHFAQSYFGFGARYETAISGLFCCR